jgi:hypothetical protein
LFHAPLPAQGKLDLELSNLSNDGLDVLDQRFYVFGQFELVVVLAAIRRGTNRPGRALEAVVLPRKPGRSGSGLRWLGMAGKAFCEQA